MDREQVIEGLREAAETVDRHTAELLLTAADMLENSRTYREHTPQRVIMARLEARGIPCRAEVNLPTKSPRSRSGMFRADIVVYHGGDRVALCECKSWKRELTGRQREHYESSGLPYIVAGKDNIDEAVAWLVEKARG